ncbi:MAG TPA: hypothetical protein VM386_04790 [Acidimicrobiales bacterium]|nr:hypothetical protein [Acidimicrobiales bacterium]
MGTYYAPTQVGAAAVLGAAAAKGVQTAAAEGFQKLPVTGASIQAIAGLGTTLVAAGTLMIHRGRGRRLRSGVSLDEEV